MQLFSRLQSWHFKFSKKKNWDVEICMPTDILILSAMNRVWLSIGPVLRSTAECLDGGRMIQKLVVRRCFFWLNSPTTLRRTMFKLTRWSQQPLILWTLFGLISLQTMGVILIRASTGWGSMVLRWALFQRWKCSLDADYYFQVQSTSSMYSLVYCAGICSISKLRMYFCVCVYDAILTLRFVSWVGWSLCRKVVWLIPSCQKIFNFIYLVEGGCIGVKLSPPRCLIASLCGSKGEQLP